MIFNERQNGVAAQCPRCESRRLVAGQLSSVDAIGFAPAATRLLTLANTVRIDPLDMKACANCGLLWTEVGPEELVDKLRRGGTKEAKAWVEAGENRPLVGRSDKTSAG